MTPQNADQEETVDADVEAGEDVELPLQEGRDLDDLVLRAHEIGGHGHGREDDADRKEHLVQRARVVKTGSRACVRAPRPRAAGTIKNAAGRHQRKGTPHRFNITTAT